MVTTRRSAETVESVYGQSNSMGGVGLLERNVPRSYSEFAQAPLAEENLDAAKERMQKNLDRLLNYDRYSEQDSVAVTEEIEAIETVASQEVSLADEDIRPTSTTMQFGDGDIDQIYKEMNRQQTYEEESASGYKLNKKGKLVLVLYALAVTVILALIVINTGVLARLSNTNQAKAAELSATIEKYDVLRSEIDSISDSDYIIDVAQNEYGMVKGN